MKEEPGRARRAQGLAKNSNRPTTAHTHLKQFTTSNQEATTMKEQRTLEQVLAGDIPQVEFEMTAEDYDEWLHGDDQDYPF